MESPGAYHRLSEAVVDGVVIIFEAHLLDEAEFTLPPGIPVGVLDDRVRVSARSDLGTRKKVTAIFAASGQTALGAMRALRELSRRIPADNSVVGFDDMEEAHSFWPPLTSVRQDFTSVGRLSIQKILRKITQTETAAKLKTTVPTELIVRASTGPPPK